MQDTLPQQITFGPTIHAALDQFETIDVSLGRTIGEAARTVTATSVVRLSCSMSRSGRMVIGSNSHSENSSEEKGPFLQYITFGICEAAGKP